MELYKIFPLERKGSGWSYTLLESDILSSPPPLIFLQREDVALRLSAHVQVVPPTKGRLPLRFSKSVKKRPICGFALCKSHLFRLRS